jgi:hypothetical protein
MTRTRPDPDIIEQLEAADPILGYELDRLRDLPGCLDEIKAAPRGVVVAAIAVPVPTPAGGGISFQVAFSLKILPSWSLDEVRAASRAWDAVQPALLSHVADISRAWIAPMHHAVVSGLAPETGIDATALREMQHASGEELTRKLVEYAFARLEAAMNGAAAGAN